ncbi:MAG: hypothetical protein H7Y00_12240 [Fimbriimonadaceae bacterium]|nr:hypothetical protein [Chitinophagales bacterium]
MFRKKAIQFTGLLFTLITLFFIQSCRRENFNDSTDVRLKFSTDTVHFDTVFATVGSATRSFKIYNTYNQPVLISNIQLAGGAPSLFRMNVDGIPSTNLSDIEIPGNDSLYVFVEVTVDPNSDALPYIVEDSIFFTTNGNIQKVVLDSWGQNAHFIDNTVYITDQEWFDDLPYVIYNLFGVDTLATLTIHEGCRIYVHANSDFLVLGSLKVLGTKDSVVTFQADRLESFFKDVPGQWNGISILRTSTGNVIEHARIKNAINGVMVGFQGLDSSEAFFEDIGTRAELTISHTIISDCQGIGLLSANSKIDATNCLIYNTGENNTALISGGEYNFKYCTFANYGSVYLTPQSASLAITDFFVLPFGNNTVAIQSLDAANFTNCISYGSAAEGKDLILNNDGEAIFNYSFTKCFLRTDTSLADFDDCFINIDPRFSNISERNYFPDSLSQTINTALTLPEVLDDLIGTFRPQGPLPDIGCYETL